MMGMPRGMGGPPIHRPAMRPNVPIDGSNAILLKPETEEDDMNDLEALLNKKTLKETQKSKKLEKNFVWDFGNGTEPWAALASKVASVLQSDFMSRIYEKMMPTECYHNHTSAAASSNYARERKKKKKKKKERADGYRKGKAKKKKKV
ncbi:hypothetical protein F0562_017670 [Nyssa sinensis]|uniref:Uncharacterized protein n=1 Tax=Nyssa sinensis TaxID=561372 RepID=A0A5J4ZJD3_9ASTE|nr:hypothetical protein F0562_017670 [Nyssa sinensis]